MALDQFFKELREIQKKERANSSLARIRSDFYKRTYKILDKLKTNVENNPFSNEHYLLTDIQRIATEICERREHKIADAAVMNVQRSYHLFQGKTKFDLEDTSPLNLTKEEEQLYFSLIDNLKNHRQDISLDKLAENLENDYKTIKSKLVKDSNNHSSGEEISPEKIDNDLNNNVLNSDENKLKVEKTIKEDNEFDNNYSNDKVLNRLNEIKKAKIIKNENYESIDEQINKSSKPSHVNDSKSIDLKETKENNKVQSSKSGLKKIKTGKTNNNLDLENILKNEDEQFVELKEENINHDSDFDNTSNFSKDGKDINETILIFNKIGAIVGVDEKIYGPFYPQDIVVMPNENANIIIKNKKGRLIHIESS